MKTFTFVLIFALNILLVSCSDDSTSSTQSTLKNVSIALNDFSTLYGSKEKDSNINAIAINSNKIYSAGTTNGPLKLFNSDKNTSYFGGSDCVIYKHSLDGKIEKIITFGGSGDDYIYDIKLDGDFYYVFGQFSGSMDVDGKHLTSNGVSDLFLAKYYENNDTLISIRSFGGSNTQQMAETGLKMLLSPSNIILVGSATNTVYSNASNTTPKHKGRYDIWTISFSKKYFDDFSIENQAKVVSYFNTLGTAEADESVNDAVLCSDKIVLVGGSYGNFAGINSNPNSLNEYKSDAYIVALDSETLVYHWGRRLGYPTFSETTTAVTCNNDKIYTSSNFMTKRWYGGEDGSLENAYYLNFNTLNPSNGSFLANGSAGVYKTGIAIKRLRVVDDKIFAIGTVWGSIYDTTIFSHPRIVMLKLNTSQENIMYIDILGEIGKTDSFFKVGDVAGLKGALYIGGQVENTQNLGFDLYTTDLIEDSNRSKYFNTSYLLKRVVSTSLIDSNISILSEVALISTKLSQYRDEKGSFKLISPNALNIENYDIIKGNIYMLGYPIDTNITDKQSLSAGEFDKDYLVSKVSPKVYYNFKSSNDGNYVYINLSIEYTLNASLRKKIEDDLALYFHEGVDSNGTLETGISNIDGVLRIKLN